MAKRSRSNSQMLHGTPMFMNSRPSGEKAVNFQPWCSSVGRLKAAVRSAGSPGFSSLPSMPS
jgi:hypothetical protein